MHEVSKVFYWFSGVGRSENNKRNSHKTKINLLKFARAKKQKKKPEQNKTTTNEIIETTFCYCRLPIQLLTMGTQFMWSFEDSSGFYTCSTGVRSRVRPLAIIIHFIVFLHIDSLRYFIMQIT